MRDNERNWPLIAPEFNSIREERIGLEDLLAPAEPRRINSFLPAAAECFIDLNQGEKLIAPRLNEIQLGDEQILIRIERIEHCVHPAAKSHVGQTLAILQRRHERFSVGADFPNLLILNQRIRYIAESRLNCLFVLGQRASLLRFSKFHLRGNTAGGKDRLGNLWYETPHSPGSREKTSKCRALEPEFSRECDGWKVSRFGYSNIRIRRNQDLLRGLDIGAPLKECRCESGWNFRRRPLSGDEIAASNGPGAFSQQQTDQIFRLLDLTLVSRDYLGGCVYELLSLAHIQQCSYPALQLRPEQTQGRFTRTEGVSRDLELHIESQKIEIGRGDIADQSSDHFFTVPVTCQQLCLGRFGRTPEPPPNVDLEREQAEEDFAVSALAGRWLRNRQCAVS